MTTPPHVTGLYTIDAALAGQSNSSPARDHLFLPALVLTSYTVGLLLTRFARSAVLEILIRTTFVRPVPRASRPARSLLRYVLRGGAGAGAHRRRAGVRQPAFRHGAGRVDLRVALASGQDRLPGGLHLDLPGVMGVGLLIGGSTCW